MGLRAIPGYEGYYAVDECTKDVVSVARTVIRADGVKLTYKQRKLKSSGRAFSLCKNGIANHKSYFEILALVGLTDLKNSRYSLCSESVPVIKTWIKESKQQ
jgi:hypothetical protein